MILIKTVRLNTDGEVTFANASARDCFGERIVGSDFADLFPNGPDPFKQLAVAGRVLGLVSLLGSANTMVHWPSAAAMPGTPRVRVGEVRVEERWELFRALAFAMTTEDFLATGGFHAGYTGHGLEDADFAEVVRRAGGTMAWVGGATAYLQPGDEVTLAIERLGELTAPVVERPS